MKTFSERRSTVFWLIKNWLKTHHFHTKLPYQKPMLRQIAWWVQNGPITKNGELSVTALFLWKFCFCLRSSYKELIWCTSDPNAHIPLLFVSAGVLFDGAFSLGILNTPICEFNASTMFKVINVRNLPFIRDESWATTHSGNTFAKFMLHTSFNKNIINFHEPRYS